MRPDQMESALLRHAVRPIGLVPAGILLLGWEHYLQANNLVPDIAHWHQESAGARRIAASKLGEQERLTLLEIADKLRIASETFSAFRTGKKLERDTCTLRDQALAMGALLEPAEQESAA